jgi:penicillin-binding protein 1A
MERALSGQPQTASRVPSGIKLIQVDPSTGERSGPGERFILEAFKPGTEPSDPGIVPLGHEPMAEAYAQDAPVAPGPTDFR